MPTVDSLDIQVSATLNQTEKALDSLVARLGEVKGQLSGLSAQAKKTGSSSKSDFSVFNNTLKSSYKHTTSLAAMFGKFYANYFMVIRGVKKLWSSIEGTTDYIEALNYQNVAFGKISSEWDKEWEKYGYDNAEAYADSFTDRINDTLGKLSGVRFDEDAQILKETGMKNLGLNLQTITQYASQLASVTNSVGQTGEVSLAAADAFTKLAGDMSSLFNVDYSSVAKNLQSGLIGQSRALYKYGIDITNATLQTYAYELGLEKAVSEMTQAEKMQLRMIAILEQSKVSWGDLANTINSPSNMIRQFTTNLKEAGMVLGQLFLPMLQKVLPVMNGVSIAAKRLLTDIAGLLGIKIDVDAFGQGYTDLGEDIDGIADSLDDVTASAKKAKAGLRGFDELNVINMGDAASGDSNGGAGSIDLTQQILDATEEYNKVWQDAYDQMENRAQEFADKVSVYFEPIKKLISDIKIGDWFSVGQDVSNIAIGILDFFERAIEKVDWDDVGNDIGEFLEGLEWKKIMKGVGDVAFEALKSAISLWGGMFEESPMGTLVITFSALSFLLGTNKMTGALFSSKLATALGMTASTASAFTFTVAASLTILWGIENMISNEESPVRKWLKDNIKPSENLSKKDIEETEKALNDFSFAAMFSSENIRKNIEENTLLNSAFVKRLKADWKSLFDEDTWTFDGVTKGFRLVEEKLKLFRKDFNQTMEDTFGEWAGVTLPEAANAIAEWFNDDVGPWFESATNKLVNDAKRLFDKDTWTWEGVTEGFVSAIDSIKSLWNNFSEWLNDKLSFEIEPITMFGKEVTKGKTVSLGKIPKFYNGGFVPTTADVFLANENRIPELVGTIGGKTAVASGTEITGIRDAIYSTGQSEASLLQTAVGLLQIIAEKEFGISKNDIGRAARDYAREYTERTKKPAYTF